MLLLHANIITPRLQYIVNFFSQELFDRPIRITANRREFIDHKGARINYTPDEITEDEFFIRPVALLFENTITPQPVHCFELDYRKAFFETKGDIHFDIFAASFYLISRYEEYLPHRKDEYGRFAHAQSLAFTEGFLDQPLINIWLDEFKKHLSRKFPSLQFRGKHFVNLVTYDIDIAYSYLGKGFLRNAGGALRSLLRGQWRLLRDRWQVLFGGKKDPFDCFEWLDALHLYCRIQPSYFFLVARKTSRYDKNVSTASRRFRQLIEYYGSNYNVGIHPSWQSGDNHRLLSEEKEWLGVITEKDISASRQHYIRMSLPVTYRTLLDAGITRDFSMGYGGINGFRASVCSPFSWYDLERERETSLMVYPFCFMDATAFYKTRSTPQQAYTELIRYHDAVAKLNGTLITIWHNHLLGTDPATKGWNTMFELFMKETVYWDAYYDGNS